MNQQPLFEVPSLVLSLTDPNLGSSESAGALSDRIESGTEPRIALHSFTHDSAVSDLSHWFETADLGLPSPSMVRWSRAGRMDLPPHHASAVGFSYFDVVSFTLHYPGIDVADRSTDLVRAFEGHQSEIESAIDDLLGEWASDVFGRWLIRPDFCGPKSVDIRLFGPIDASHYPGLSELGSFVSFPVLFSPQSNWSVDVDAVRFLIHPSDGPSVH